MSWPPALLGAPARVAGAARLAIPLIWLALAIPAIAASPSPSPSAGIGGDPRSSGEGPGLVGDPAFALFAVVAIGVGALVLTLLYVRLTANRPR
jgi:hypothetical protein